MKAPGHVLMTADAVGGVWMYALELSRALAARGVRITLAAVGPPPSDDQRADAQRIPGLDLIGREGRLEWMDKPWADVEAAGDWLSRVADDLRPDIIHLNDFSHGARKWPGPSVVVAHSCVVSWWNAVHGCDPPPSWTKYRQCVRAGLLGADVTVAVSRAMADAVARHYAVRAPEVVWNGRLAAEYRPGSKEDFVLTSGRAWDEAKNIAGVNDAARQIAWPVWLAGETRRPDGGEVDVRQLRSLGRLPATEVRSLFSRAAIYALPALYEPFGLSVLEAALSGCALVLGDIPSLREIWGDAALYVNGRDASAVSAAVNQLIGDRNARIDLARRARFRALSLSPERMMSGYLDMYARARERFTTGREAAQCAS